MKSMIALVIAMVMGCDHHPRPPKVEPVEPAAKVDEAQPEPSPAPGSGSETGSGAGSGTGSGSAAGSATGSAAGPGSGPDAVAAAAAALRAKNPEMFDKCGAAAKHALGLALAETPESSRANALRDQPAQMQSMREQCVNQAWSADLLGCINRASDVDGLVRCQSLLPQPGGAGP